ncbi:MAG: Uma2 family endonuclease [Deltaproteobacteria bacterium]|nr:Uma2 family endonuclease [Deltaproteobacteria bacterium]
MSLVAGTEYQETSTKAPAPPRMAYEEFLDWADDGTSAEWINGEVIFMGPASRQHQELIVSLSSLLTFFVQWHRLGTIFVAPFQMKTGPDLPGREPDILFIGRDHLDRIKNTYLDGPADLAVEIVSVDSLTRDRTEKYREYEQGGVREYWLIDPLHHQAEFYHLGDDGSYYPIRIGEDHIFYSRVLPGLWLDLDWLWLESGPLLIPALQAWGFVKT